jgi:hypothetical protein
VGECEEGKGKERERKRNVRREEGEQKKRAAVNRLERSFEHRSDFGICAWKREEEDRCIANAAQPSSIFCFQGI